MNEAPPLPTEVIESFATAAQTALLELTQFESFPGDASPEIAIDTEGEFITAAVRLQRATPGVMTLILPVATASQLAARYLPAGTELSADIIDDVVGEFANVIAGQAKTMLKGTPFHFTLSTPAVSRATGSALRPAATAKQLAVVLEFEAGRLLLLVDLPACPGA